MTAANLEFKLWRWQRIGALALVPLVAFHLAYQYFVIGLDSISFTVVSAKLHSLILLAIDLLLLVAAATHGLIGLRGLILDYTSSPALAARVTAAILIATAALFIYGVAALLAFR